MAVSLVVCGLIIILFGFSFTKMIASAFIPTKQNIGAYQERLFCGWKEHFRPCLFTEVYACLVLVLVDQHSHIVYQQKHLSDETGWPRKVNWLNRSIAKSSN